MKNQLQKGFTLIELLVVVTIIAILALIVLLALNPVEMARRSRDSRRLSDIGTVRRAIDLSLADGKTLSGTTAPHYTKTTAVAGALDPSSVTNLVGVDVSKYLSTITQDPSYVSGDATTVQTTDGICGAAPGTAQVAKSAMVYSFESDGSTYVLSAHLESTDNCGVPSGDGNINALYEVGTKPNLHW